MANTDHFEAYYNDELSIRETLEFEERLQHDTELKEQYKDFVALMEVLHMPAREAMRQTIKNLSADIENEQSSKSAMLEIGEAPIKDAPMPKIIKFWPKTIYRIAAIAATLAGFYFGYQWFLEANRMSSPPLALEYMDMHNELLPEKNGLLGGFRDGAAVGLYQAKDLKALRKYVQQHNDSDHAHFLLAVLLLQSDEKIAKSQIQEATHSLQKVIASPMAPPILRDEASWCLAQSKLSLGQAEEARSILENLVQHAQSEKIQRLAELTLKNIKNNEQ